MVVEFPEEGDEDGNIPMDIISGTWVFLEPDGQQMCYWPPFKTDLAKNKAVVNHQQFEKDRAGTCIINIKYRSSK